MSGQHEGALAEMIAGWTPGPTETVDRVTPWSVAAFSSLLDLPEPAAGEGDPLPPLWHWFAFLDHPRASELGDDGHPDAGHFLPPVPDRRRMFAGGRLEVRGTWRVGEEVTRRAELGPVEVKSGRSGEMAFVTVRSTFSRGDDVLAVENQDIVYRSQSPGEQRAVGVPAEREGPDPVHKATLELTPGPTHLFRYSALTYNTHRIHYDEPYVTGVEGYPGLVVHGPLLAMLLLELPRRSCPVWPVTSFSYRLRRPVFAGQTVVAGASADAEGLAVSAAVPGAPDSVTGHVGLGGLRA